MSAAQRWKLTLRAVRINNLRRLFSWFLRLHNFVIVIHGREIGETTAHLSLMLSLKFTRHLQRPALPSAAQIRQKLTPILVF